MYFNKNLFLLPVHSLSDLGGYDNFAKLFFQITSPIFRENIQLYLIVELFIVIGFFVLFYKILLSITKDNLIALTSTIFMSTNYVALFEYVAAGNYQRFIQRFPNLIPAFLAFYLLWKFYQLKKVKYLFISFLLYALAVLMGHFSTMLMPAYVILSFVQLLDEKVNIKKIFIRLIISLCFVGLTILITSKGEQNPTGIFHFFKTEKNIVERIIYQIPLITIPINLFPFIARSSLFSIRYPYIILQKIFLIPTLFIYIYGTFLVIKRAPKLLVLYLTSFVTMIAIMFLYMYVDPRLNVLKSYGQDRYYLLSSLFACIMWAIALKAFFIKNTKRYLYSTILIICLFVVNNFMSIWTHIDKIQYESVMNKKFINYILQNKQLYTNDSVIVVPYYLNWPAPIITEFITNHAAISLPFENWEKEFWPNKSNVYVYDYYLPNIPGKDPDPNSGNIIDLTKKYQSGEKIIFIR